MGFPQPAPMGGDPFTSDGVKIGSVGPSSKAGMTMNADTNVYRDGANILRTSDDFYSDTDIYARAGGANSVGIGQQGPASEAGLKFGIAGDTNLYRSAADTLKSDDNLRLGKQLAFTADFSSPAACGVGKNSNQLAFNGGSSGYLWNNDVNTVNLMLLSNAGALSLAKQLIFLTDIGSPAAYGVGKSGTQLLFNGGSAGCLWNDDANTINLMTLDNAGVLSTKKAMYPGTPASAMQTACGLHAGTGAPNNANGANGDVYFRSDGGALSTVYHKRAGVWVGVV